MPSMPAPIPNRHPASSAPPDGPFPARGAGAPVTPRRPAFGMAFAVALGLGLAWAAPAQALPHETTQGPYTLRSNVVASTDLAQSSAAHHGIRRAAGRAVLDVLVERADGARRRPVHAAVKARMRSASGTWRKIPMRAVEAGGRVSYVGDFGHAPRETLDFEINANPDHTELWLHVQFQQRMAAR